MEFEIEKIKKIFQVINTSHLPAEEDILIIKNYFGNEIIENYFNFLKFDSKLYKFSHKKHEFFLIKNSQKKIVFIDRSLNDKYYCSECNLILSIQPICFHCVFTLFWDEVEKTEIEDIAEFLIAKNEIYSYLDLNGNDVDAGSIITEPD